MPNVKAIPEGFEGATPYLCCSPAAEAIEFYKRAFNAVEHVRLGEPGGPIGHAELTIGKAHIFLADEFPDHGFLSPRTIGGTPVTIQLYVENADAVVEAAIANGAKLLRPVADQFYGDRGGQIEDPSGHRWWIATHIEDVSMDELRARASKR